MKTSLVLTAVLFTARVLLAQLPSGLDDASAYTIRSKVQGKHFAAFGALIPGGSPLVKSSGQNVVALIGGFNGAPTENWRLKDAGDGFYYLIAERGWCLDVYGGSKADGDPVVIAPMNGSDSQKWSIVPAGGKYFYIESAISGQRLDVKNGADSSDLTLCHADHNDTDAQKWWFKFESPLR